MTSWRRSSADDPLATRTYHTLVAKFLALVHIADVYLDGRCADRLEGIQQSHAGVGVSTRIKHYAIVVESYLVDAVDEVTLMVALQVVNLYLRISAAQLLEVSLETLGTIDARFALAQQVQVGPIDDLYLGHGLFLFKHAINLLLCGDYSRFFL